LEAEIAFGYPSGFRRVELLEQAARYLTWACSFAEAPWPSEVENLENEVREFRSGWNGYLTSISDQLQGITGLACWASAEEVTAVSKAGPLYQNQHRVKANDELLWIGGDKLVVRLALLKRSSELLSRTDVFRESQTALEALRAIFEQERIEVGLRSTIEGSARKSALVASNASSGTLPTATFQERNSESPLAKFPDSTLALLIFEQQLRVLPLDQKTAYANCVLFLSRRGEDADHAALRHFYQIFTFLALPATERRQLVWELFSAPDRHQEPPTIPRFTDELICLSLFMNVLIMAERNLTQDKEQYLSRLAGELRVLKTGAGNTDLKAMLTQLATLENVRRLSELAFEIAALLPDEGNLKRRFQIAGVSGRGIHGILSASSPQTGTDAPRYDIGKAKSLLHEQLRRAIDGELGSVSAGADIQGRRIKLREMRTSYEQLLRDDWTHFDNQGGFFPSTKQKRRRILSAIDRLLGSGTSN